MKFAWKITGQEFVERIGQSKNDVDYAMLSSDALLLYLSYPTFFDELNILKNKSTFINFQSKIPPWLLMLILLLWMSLICLFSPNSYHVLIQQQSYKEYEKKLHFTCVSVMTMLNFTQLDLIMNGARSCAAHTARRT